MIAGSPSLFLASQDGHLEIVKHLIECAQKEKVHFGTINFAESIIYSFHNKHISVTDRLIEQNDQCVNIHGTISDNIYHIGCNFTQEKQVNLPTSASHVFLGTNMLLKNDIMLPHENKICLHKSNISSIDGDIKCSNINDNDYHLCDLEMMLECPDIIAL